MQEIKLYQDRQKQNEIKDQIIFDTVVAGEIALRKIYIFNNTDYVIRVEVSVEEDDVAIKKAPEEILTKQTAEVIFELSPALTKMGPVIATLQIKVRYLMR